MALQHDGAKDSRRCEHEQAHPLVVYVSHEVV